MSGGLNFLKSISLASNAAVKPTARTSSAVAKNPTNADIRIYKNGGVFPSAKLVTACDLAYRAKDSVEKGNGFDVFSSKEFLNTKHVDPAFLIIAMVPRNDKKGRITLFSSTKFEADGQPTADVLTQGSTTAGKEILEMIKEVYGIELGENDPFIDLKVIQENPMNTDDNIYWIPKVTSRGEKKGDVDMIRREDLTLYPLAPISMLGESSGKEADEQSQGTLSDIEAGTGDDNAPEPASVLPAGVLEEDPSGEPGFTLEVDPEEEDDTLKV